MSTPQSESWDDLCALAGLADLGELAGPVVHEISNFLNVFLLQLTILEMTLPQEVRGGLAAVGEHGRAAARVLHQWQQHGQRERAATEPADLNSAIRAAVGRWQRELGKMWQQPAVRVVTAGADTPGEPAGVTVRLALAADLPRVPASVHELERLCLFLLRNALDALGAPHGEILVHTECVDSTVILRIEDTGQPIAPEFIPQFFEVASPGRAGARPLELAACKSIVRRRGGKIRAENRPAGGVAVAVELPAARA